MLQGPASAHGMFHMQATFLNDPRQVDGLRRRLFDANHLEAVRCLLHVVHDVVKLGGQHMDVFAVERRNETAVERFDDPADNVVAGMFLHAQLVAARREAVERGHHVQEFARGPADDDGGLVEQVEKLLFARQERETHERTSPGWP